MPRSTSMFAAYPAPFVYDGPGGKKIQQLLWGDWVEATNEMSGSFRRVAKARNSSGWMRDSDLIGERLLELNFVDVGQGDGCFIVTPGDRFIVIDAGQDDNMFWYLRWRFNLRDHPERVLRIDDAICSHPDFDHYGGFAPIFESPQIEIGTLYHSGIVDRAGEFRFGEERQHNGRDYLVDLVPSKAALKRLVRDDASVARLSYPRLLRTALASGRVDDIRMLSSRDGHLDGYADGELRIEVLGPAPEMIDRKLALRRLGNDGVTKNGHSIVLKVHYRDVTLGLGGDLNGESQRYLLEHHCEIDVAGIGGDPSARDEAVESARAVFSVDVAKACHHGSSDFEDLFLEATDATATVMSSGDNEPYAHPRPDALGATGKYGRGRRPLIFSTELARSVNVLERPERIRSHAAPAIDDQRAAVNATGTTPEEEPGRLVAQYQRAIAVYGLITVRTDGHRVLLAQKLEKASGTREFDYHCLEPDNTGTLTYKPNR